MARRAKGLKRWSKRTGRGKYIYVKRERERREKCGRTANFFHFILRRHPDFYSFITMGMCVSLGFQILGYPRSDLVTGSCQACIKVSRVFLTFASCRLVCSRTVYMQCLSSRCSRNHFSVFQLNVTGLCDLRLSHRAVR